MRFDASEDDCSGTKIYLLCLYISRRLPNPSSFGVSTTGTPCLIQACALALKILDSLLKLAGEA